MGLLDDTASVLSVRSSRSKRSKSHRSSRHSRDHRDQRSHHRSRSRSRSRHRSSYSVVSGGGGGSDAGGGGGVADTLKGVAASVFGTGDDEDDLGYGDHYRRRRSSGYHDGYSSSSSDSSSDGIRSFITSLPNNVSKGSSFFTNFGRGRSSPSFIKRSPRRGFIRSLVRKLRRLVRDLIYYAKRHPLKVFVLVLVPLITGGALTALLARLGLRLPPFLERLLGVAARAAGAGAAGDSLGLVGEAVRMVRDFGGGSSSSSSSSSLTKAVVERGRDGGVNWERRRYERDYDSYGGGRGEGWKDGLKSIAKVFD